MQFEDVGIDEALKFTKTDEGKTQVRLETKEYQVVDPDTGQVVGIIDAPLTFCPGPPCNASVGKKHPHGFINALSQTKDPRELWVHQHCLRPSIYWWRNRWRSMVVRSEGITYPWDD
jgi:hypothetical protein